MERAERTGTLPAGPRPGDRVLVTGGAGFIGSHTVDLLLDKGYEVRVLDSLQPRVHPFGKPPYLPDRVEFIQGDVADRETLDRALRGMDHVIHLAAYQDYMTDFSTFFTVNTVSTALIYELILANQHPIRKIVHASSQAVYGEGKYRCEEHGVMFPGARLLDQLQQGQWEHICPRCGRQLDPVLIDEDMVKPHTAYGISKYALEMAAFNLGRKYNIPSAAMRYSIVLGPRNSFYNAYSGICRIFTTRLLSGQPPIAYEDGGQLRDYVHVHDVARANVLAMEDDRASFEAFNVGGQTGTTVLEMARIVAEACGQDITPVVPGEFRFGDTRHTVSDSSKLKALGWEPRASAHQIVADYVAWVREQPRVRDYYADTEKVMKQSGVVRSVVPRPQA